mmetsp:Transcript_45113/g.130533  ORF Transcript_45113/g.130533 Transcript_45113/m.130533 type:complete len:231 (-) Transcript_45113:1131-1823(-)
MGSCHQKARELLQLVPGRCWLGRKPQEVEETVGHIGCMQGAVVGVVQAVALLNRMKKRTDLALLDVQPLGLRLQRRPAKDEKRPLARGIERLKEVGMPRTELEASGCQELLALRDRKYWRSLALGSHGVQSRRHCDDHLEVAALPRLPHREHGLPSSTGVGHVRHDRAHGVRAARGRLRVGKLAARKTPCGRGVQHRLHIVHDVRGGVGQGDVREPLQRGRRTQLPRDGP